MLRALAALPRRVRWAMHRWSPAADRDFHECLFSGRQYEPFSFAYPGYLTIRRFAELAQRHLDGVRHAADFGCGPGEITCELARRNPAIDFVGIDHSETAIQRARAHQAALKLGNVRFAVGDISAVAAGPFDAVLMFDSFHHLLDPKRFVQSLRAQVPRFILVEPAGDWLGGWQKTIDLDWIVPAIDSIRSRLVWQLNLPPGPVEPPQPQADVRGAPVEHRYTFADLVGFFEGYGLEARGTIAGLEKYPPQPFAALPMREAFGEIAFQALTSIEDLLVRENLDLHAKHWVICAERGAPQALRTPRPVDPRDEGLAVQGAYDVEYLQYEGPSTAPPSSVFSVSVTLRNGGWRTWRSDDPAHPVFASYHWLRKDGSVAAEDGRRTPLPRQLGPGETLTMTCMAEAPPVAGTYVLALDLVEEGVTWFSGAGAPMHRVPVQVRARRFSGSGRVSS